MKIKKRNQQGREREGREDGIRRRCTTTGPDCFSFGPKKRKRRGEKRNANTMFRRPK